MRIDRECGLTIWQSIIKVGFCRVEVQLWRFWVRLDFIHVYYQEWHYPIFNIADCAICIGAAILIWDSFTEDKNAREPEVSA